MNKPSIAIVGGSIAGLSTAILLKELGFNVKVHERRNQESMKNMGAGIVLPTDLIKQLKTISLLDQDFPSIALNERIFSILDDNKQEKKLAVIPMSGSAIHYGILYNQLAKRLSLDTINYKERVTDVTRLENKVILTVNQSEKFEYDLALFADGYRSSGRKYLFPNVELESPNYTCWQGNYTIPKNQISHIENQIMYYPYQKGVLLIYQIPSLEGNAKDTITLTWFLYETIDSAHPFFRDNKIHTNIYQNEITTEYLAHLHHLANEYFPSLGKQVLINTQNPFTHAIYDVMVESYVNNNIGLLGDAGILLRPHLGSGATKALQDAVSLKEFFQLHSDVSDALKKWGIKRQKEAANLFNLSRAFGNFLVAKPPHWQALDSSSLNKMWDGVCEGYEWYQHIKLL